MSFHETYFPIAKRLYEQGPRNYNAQQIIVGRNAGTLHTRECSPFYNPVLSRPVLWEVMCLNTFRPTKFGKYGVIDPDASAMLSECDVFVVLWFDGDVTHERGADLFISADCWQSGPLLDSYTAYLTLPGAFRTPQPRRPVVTKSGPMFVVVPEVEVKPAIATPKKVRVPKPPPPPPKILTPEEEKEKEQERLTQRFLNKRKRTLSRKKKAGTLVVHKTVKKSSKHLKTGKAKHVKVHRAPLKKKKGR